MDAKAPPPAPRTSANPICPDSPLSHTLSKHTHGIRTQADESVPAEKALQKLKEGNSRYVGGKTRRQGFNDNARQALAQYGQNPFATVVGCADSRCPIEILFDVMPGDVFVLRNAGNTCTHAEGSMVGSVEYSVGHLHTNLILVLGHTKCGAIAGATSTAMSKTGKPRNNDAPSSTLEKLLDSLGPVALQAAAEMPPDASVDEVAAHAVRVNVFHTIEKLLTYSKPLRDKVNQGTLQVQGAIYDIVTGKVEFLGLCPRQALVLDMDTSLVAREESIVASASDASATAIKPPGQNVATDSIETEDILASDATAHLLMSEQKAQLQRHYKAIEQLLITKLDDHSASVRSLLASYTGGAQHGPSPQSSGQPKETPIKIPGADEKRSSEPEVSKSDENVLQSIKELESAEKGVCGYLGLNREAQKTMYDSLTKKRLPLAWLKSMIESSIFNAIVAILILANAVVIAFASDYSLKAAIKRFEYGPAATSIDTIDTLDPEWASKTESAFCVIFALELVIRILALEGEFIVGAEWKWNALDCILVVFSVLEIALKLSGFEVFFIRTLRLLRMLRSARIIRLLHFFRTLQLMLISALNSLRPLLWALIFVALVVYVFAVVLVQGVATYVGTDDDVNPSTVHKLLEYFDSVPRTLLSLFQSVSGGLDWVEPCKPLLQVSVAFAFILIAYISFMLLVVFNIVTGIFVNDAVEMAEQKRDYWTNAEICRTKAIAKEFKTVFYERGSSQSGAITRNEFDAFLKNQDYHRFFTAMGLDHTNAEQIFNLLDMDAGGEVEIEEFVVGCMQLKGGAKTVSVEAMMRENNRFMRRWKKNADRLEREICQVANILLSGGKGWQKLQQPIALSSGAGTSEKSSQTSVMDTSYLRDLYI